MKCEMLTMPAQVSHQAYKTINFTSLFRNTPIKTIVCFTLKPATILALKIARATSK